MTRELIARINARRLVEWEEILTANHATAAILIGIGHDESSGTIHVHIPEDLPDEVAACYLGQAFTILRQRKGAAA